MSEMRARGFIVNLQPQQGKEMFTAQPRANELFLRCDAAVRSGRVLLERADDLLETSRVVRTVQPSACATRPGRDLQTACRGAPFPGWQERIEPRAQVPRTFQRLSQHFELRSQGQPTEGRRAGGGSGS